MPSARLARTTKLRLHLVYPGDKRVVAQDQGVWPEIGLVRSGSESTDSQIFEEHVFCNRRPEDGGNVTEQDQTLAERVACNTFKRTGSCCADAKA